MTEEEQKIIDKLPKWTEEFVQRKWYREFLQTFPLSEYPSLLQTIPQISIMIQNYVINHNLLITDKEQKLCYELQHDFLSQYYKDIGIIIIFLGEKYNEIVYDDIYYITLYSEWFIKNIKVNVELDKKYNLN